MAVARAALTTHRAPEPSLTTCHRLLPSSLKRPRGPRSGLTRNGNSGSIGQHLRPIVRSSIQTACCRPTHLAADEHDHRFRTKVSAGGAEKSPEEPGGIPSRRTIRPGVNPLASKWMDRVTLTWSPLMATERPIPPRSRAKQQCPRCHNSAPSWTVEPATRLPRSSLSKSPAHDVSDRAEDQAAAPLRQPSGADLACEPSSSSVWGCQPIRTRFDEVGASSEALKM